MARIWVTRTQPKADETAKRLRALGHDPLVEPVLEVRPVAGVALDLEGVSSLAFTSPNGVSAFASLSPVRNLPVFAVGDATAQAAHEAGFSAVRSAGGDLADLSALISREGRGRIVHPGPREPAGDLPGAETIAVYETVGTGAAAPADIDGVLIHSPKAARAVAAALEGRAEAVCAYAISEAAAAPLSRLNFRLVAVAPYPNEEALLKLLPA